MTFQFLSFETQNQSGDYAFLQFYSSSLKKSEQMYGSVLANLEFQPKGPGIYHFSLTPNFPLILSNFYFHLLSFPDETAI